MFIPTPNGSDFKIAPDGTHLAICYQVVDLGTQETAFSGETKKTHKVRLAWELSQEKMDDGRPFTVSQTFTWSMHEKASLRKALEAWRGMAFMARDFGPNGFDIKNVLGKSCTLSVVHTVADNGNTYANIASIGKAMKGIEVPQRVNPLVYLWLVPERWDAKVFSELPPYLQAKIVASPEYNAMMNAADRGDSHHHAAEAADSDIPF